MCNRWGGTNINLVARRISAFTLLVGFASLVGQGKSLLADEISFNRDIRPILSDLCFHCHGPDGASREADLRLDLQEEVFKKRETPLLLPGKPENSELFRRLVHSDVDQRMPPAEIKRAPSAEQIETIRKWIEQGAKWENHWAFIAPLKKLPPSINAEWEKNEIDRFVFHALKAKGLQPSNEADRRTLIRRVTQDLTGLPPTPTEIEDFVSDRSSKAYEKVVDRLLASPHYGERMAQVWLDAARYADSHGYSLDRRRVMWPWRDWVIQAYNQNKPFDEFATEQLAGDLLPNATVGQKLATGFNRNHPIQSEGGVINEEYRIETVVDRVETTSAVFLGLTMGCGRCHDHKYEPISQQEFYQFFAFFNNVPESAHVGNADNQADRPFLQAPSPLRSSQIEAVRKEIQKLEKSSEPQNKNRKMVEQFWVDDELPAGAQSFGNGSGPNKFLFVEKGDDHPVLSGKKSSFRESKGLGQHGFTGASKPVLMQADTRLVTYVHLDKNNPPRQIMLQWNSGNSWEHRAYWGDDLIPWGVKDSISRKHMGELPKAGEWTRLEVLAADVGLVGKPLSGWAFTQFDGKVHWDKAGWVAKEKTPREIQLEKLRNELIALEKDSPTVMIMAEMNPPRKTFILDRGRYDAPSKKEVFASIPAVLGKLPDTDKANRLSLAKWIFSSANPLTARVTVNRYWQMYFGTGLVSTSEDFGTQGASPTHPELLDWLAIEFVESGWNVKALQKKIVMSATYRQSSGITKEALEKDPGNRWFSRGPRFRLSAEGIRDQALAISGLLVRKIGGPSVRPYQPPGLWKDVVYSNVPKFKQDHGQDLYRRSLYTYWKRSVPPPNLQTLDAPSREACTLKRSRTNTPLAKLVLWNDPTFVEAARVFAERMVQQEKSNKETLANMFESVTSRPPKPVELDDLLETFLYLFDRYQKDTQAAEELLSVGEFPRDEKLDDAKVAAFAAIANALFGLDETLTKR